MQSGLNPFGEEQSPEIFTHIFLFLDCNDLKNVILVSKFWQNVVLGITWETLFKNTFTANYAKASKDEQHSWFHKYISYHNYYQTEYKNLSEREIALRLCLQKHDLTTLQSLSPTYEEIVEYKDGKKTFAYFAMQVGYQPINDYLFSVIKEKIDKDLILLTNTNSVYVNNQRLLFYSIYFKQNCENYRSFNNHNFLFSSQGLLPYANSGPTSLHVAAYVGNVEYLKDQIDKDDKLIEISDGVLYPPLTYAVKNSVEATEFLLLKGAQVTFRTHEIRGYSKPNPIVHLAAVGGNIEVMKVLLTKTECQQQLRQIYAKETPIHIAAFRGHIKIVELFLQFDEELLEIKNKGHSSPLSSAVQGGHQEMVRFLLSKGANITTSTSHLSIIMGQNALTNAIESSTVEIFEILYLARGNNKIDFISLLHHAILKNKLDFVKKILSFDTSIINTRDFSGETPLHLAVKFNRYDIVNALLDSHADIHAKVHNPSDKTKHNLTALEIALSEPNNDKMINLLLQRGAKLFGHEQIDMEILSGKMQAKVELMQFIRQIKNDNHTHYRAGWSLFKTIEKETVLGAARKIKHIFFGDKTKSKFNTVDDEALKVSTLNNIYQRLSSNK